MARVLALIGGLIVVALIVLYAAGRGGFSEIQHSGEPRARSIDPAVTSARSDAVRAAADEIGVSRPKQILFGDLHVHSTFSFDAFQMSLPMAGGDGAYPISDACDYARHCAALDFWSITDHAIVLSQRRWQETVETIRQCNALTDDGSPDTVAYLGWEWTQVGSRPENHWGHKNVILRDLDDDHIPTRPIAAGIPEDIAAGLAEAIPSPFLVGLLALFGEGGGSDFARYIAETGDMVDCPKDVPVRDLPIDCRETAHTPEELFGKLDDWGHASMVIPHGTTWGFYTPLGSAWDKQLTAKQHDPERQRIIEVMSGHGNSEEYRDWREVVFRPDGSASCPEPTEEYLPSCWRAGEIIAERCAAEGAGARDCEQRAIDARQNYVDAIRNAGAVTVPGAEMDDWQDSGQCRDCFQPAFNYRPKSSVQYIMALNKPDVGSFKFGFIASSDNHSARPGTGYKEVARREFTEQRFGNFVDTPLGQTVPREPVARSERFEFDPSAAIFSLFETERQASFFLTGGLAAAHANGRDRDSIWDALQRREVYGTSGPRILLWFDLLNPADMRPRPMGSQAVVDGNPIFQVRAVGSFEQKPGCPTDATSAMEPDQLARLCQGECYNPTDRRRPITRIEVVRVRPQIRTDEAVGSIVEDPWKVLTCPPDPSGGCQVAFSDPEFATSGRQALYYVRAIEAPGLAVAANPLGCTRDDDGRCTEIDPCFYRPDDDECLGRTEERAWSSPIFVESAR